MNLVLQNNIFIFSGSKLTPLSICVIPENLNQKFIKTCFGVCTNFPKNVLDIN